jgi:hypothetical protein
VFTFQDERTNITYYDGVKVPDSYRLGEVNGGVKVMAGALELEHGGGFAKTQQHMVRMAEQLCRELKFRGRPLIEDTAAQVRLARATAHVMVSEVIAWRALWAGVEKKPNAGFGPMAKLFSSEKFLRGRLGSARSYGARIAFQALRSGGLSQPVLSPLPGDDDLRWNERDPSEHDCRARAEFAAHSRLRRRRSLSCPKIRIC